MFVVSGVLLGFLMFSAIDYCFTQVRLGSEIFVAVILLYHFPLSTVAYAPGVATAFLGSVASEVLGFCGFICVFFAGFWPRVFFLVIDV